MVDNCTSVSRFASQLEEEIDQIQLLEHYELTNISTLSNPARLNHEHGGGQEEQRDLGVPSQGYVLT
jgi:hypothetical protein